MTSLLPRRRNAIVAVALCVAGLLCVPAGAAAKVYFAADVGGGGTGIERAGFDGSGLELLQFQPAGFEDDLALDVAAGRMYFTDTFASVIVSANLNGSDAQTIVDDFGEEPLGVAIDSANRKLYWTDRQGVKRSNLYGGELELLTTSAARGYIALDVPAQRMYWADRPTGRIKTAAMAPGAIVTILVDHQAAPFGMAVDPAGGKLYWLELNKTDKIVRSNLDGSGVERLLERPGAGFDGGFAIDPAAGKLYWSETEARRIGTSNLDGSAAQVLFSTGEDYPEGLAVETADPHPVATAAPFVEGIAQVGEPLVCQPGQWSGTGPVSVAYQWTAAGTAIEGATSPVYVPFAEQAGQSLACVVSASDDVATSTAASAPVTVAALPSPAPAPAEPVPSDGAPHLVAGIGVDKLVVPGPTARVPVFTSLPGRATLLAIPSRWRHEPAAKGPPRRARAHLAPPTVRVMQQLTAGRGAIALRRLHPNTTYRLVLVFTSAEGQSAQDTATLRVQGR
jgi:hypothetical protein